MHRVFAYTVLLILFAGRLEGQSHSKKSGQGVTAITEWKVIETDHFNLYHLEGTERVVLGILPACINRLRNIEDKIGYRLSGRLDIYFYASHAQMSKMYVTDDEFDKMDQGGTTLIQNNNIHVFFPGSQEGLLNQVSDAIAKNLIVEMLYGGTAQERIKYSTLLHLPSWFGEGLGIYLSRGWDANADNHLRDAFNNSLFTSFNKLTPEQQVLVGRSMWKYIEEMEGSGALQRILYLVRLTRKVETALFFVTKQSSKVLYDNWYKSRSSLYAAELKRRMPSQAERFNFDGSHTQILSIDLSPTSKYLAVAEHNFGRLNVEVFNRENGEKTTIFKRFNRNRAFHTDERQVLVRWKTDDVIYVLYNDETPELYEINHHGLVIQKQIINLDYIPWLDYFDKSGEFVFSGSKNGISDLYLYQPDKKLLTTLTKDARDDLFPSFDQNGNIYFSKSSAAIQPGDKSQLDIHFLIRRDTSVLTVSNVSRTKEFDEFMPLKLNPTYLSFLSNRNGIVNAFAYNLDEEIYALSDYQSSVLWQSSNQTRTKICEVLLRGGALNVFISDIDGELNVGSILHPSNTLTLIRDHKDRSSKKDKGSEGNNQGQSNEGNKIYFQSSFPIPENVDSLERIQESNKQKKEYYSRNVEGKHVKLQSSAMFTQIDNSRFLTNVSPAFSSPKDELLNGLGFVFGMRIKDQFNRHKFDLKMRTSFSFDRFQFGFGYTNQNGEHIRKIGYYNDSYITESSGQFFKRTLRLAEGSIQRTAGTHSTFGYHQSFRNDGMVELVSGKESFLNTPKAKFVASQGLSWQYITVYHSSPWTYSGLNIKLQSDWVTGVNQKGSSVNNRLSISYGRKVRKHFTWMNHFQAGHSLGALRTVYFLGGNRNQFTPKFTTNATITERVSYFEPIYGVRNFNINVRNGNSYAFLNSELFIPVHRWLGRKPLRNSMIQNLWVVFFGDLGSAWYGKSPYDRLNPANKTIISYGPLDITVYNTRNPVVYSFGSGLRTKIFGYDVRYDLAYTIDNNIWGYHIQRLSLGMPF